MPPWSAWCTATPRPTPGTSSPTTAATGRSCSTGTAGAPVDFGVVKVPESYLVDPGGVVVAKFNGGVTQADLDDTIADFEEAG